jgi:pyruvate dehydrogenase E2 component (dihydrolipoamide acetyltransferase)
MPALSPTMEEGNLAKWLVKEGDKVGPGDVIAEIETDKATMEVEAVDEGTVGKIVVPGGTEGVKVNALIAILAGEGERCTDDAAKGGGEAGSPHQLRQAKRRPEAEKPAQAADPGRKPASRPRPIPAPSRRRKAHGGAHLLLAAGAPYRQGTASIWRRFRAPGRMAGRQEGRRGRHRLGNRQGNRFGRAAAAAGRASRCAAPKGMSDDAVLKNFRRRLLRTGQARRHAQDHCPPPAGIQADHPAFLRHRGLRTRCAAGLASELNKAAPLKDDKPAYKLSVNDMVIKALALALRDVPDANVSWTDENMVMHKHSDVGVAVSIPAV